MKTQVSVIYLLLLLTAASSVSAQMGAVGLRLGNSFKFNSDGGSEALWNYGIEGEYELLKSGIGITSGVSHMITNNPANYFQSEGAGGVFEEGDSTQVISPALHFFAPYVGAYYVIKRNDNVSTSDAASISLRAGLNAGYLLARHNYGYSQGLPFVEPNMSVMVYLYEKFAISAKLSAMAAIGELEYEGFSVKTDDDDFIVEKQQKTSTTMPLHANFSFGVHYVIGHKWRY